MEVFKYCIVTGWMMLLLSISAFSQATSQEQIFTHNEIISKIMDFSGLNIQIPQIADSIVNREDIQAYLLTLSSENRDMLKKEISTAFDGHVMLEIIQNELQQNISTEEGRELLKWYMSVDGRTMTALEETSKEREDWSEIYQSKHDPKPDAKRLKLYQYLLLVMNFTKHSTNEKTMLYRMILNLTRPDMKGSDIERYLKKKRKEIAEESYKTAMLSLRYDFATVSDEQLQKYLIFLSSPAARSYQQAKSIGFIRAISSAADKVIAKAEKLTTKHSSNLLSDIHPKTDKLKDDKEACINEDKQACFDLGFAYYKGRGIKRDYFKALVPLKMSCEGGIAKGCSVLGDMYWLARGVKRNYTKAANYFQESCDGGDMIGCTGIGMFYATGYGVTKDYHKARAYYNKACDMGEETACRNLGGFYQYGHGVERDDVKAREFYIKACNGGNMSSCYRAGIYFYNGTGVKQNFIRAKELFITGCKRGYSYACDMVGTTYLKGEGVKQNIKESIRYFNKSCTMPYNNRNGYGCYNLGMIYAMGTGVKKNLAKAKKFFQKGCKLGYRYACNSL